MVLNSNVHVALIDSGIGGFSILEPLEQLNPQATISYFMDNHYLPYGELSLPVLLERLEGIVEFLLDSNVDIVVIACNTATTQALKHLRECFDLPFVGVVPAIKPAALLTRSGIVGLLATPATVNSDYTAQLIADFATNCTVKMLGSSAMVRFSEQQFWHKEQIHIDATAGLEELFEIDTLVLGCTHFPLVKDHIQRWLPDTVTMVDPGIAVAKRVAAVIEQHHFNDIKSTSKGSKSFYCTSPLTQLQQKKLHDHGFERIKVLDFEFS